MKKNSQLLYLVRHAESEYNKTIKKYYEKINIIPSVNTVDDPEIRYNDKLFDAPITEKGIEQVINS